jgi:hypothetical protein
VFSSLNAQSVTQEDVTQEELGGSKTHTSISGDYRIYFFNLQKCGAAFWDDLFECFIVK